MGLFRKGIYWTRWLTVCVVSMIFSWFGWTVPQWTEAYQSQVQVFNSEKAIAQAGIFREQLNKEGSRALMSTPGSTVLAQSQVSQPRQAMKVEEPGRTPKTLTDKKSNKLRQPTQAFGKVEKNKSGQPTQMFGKVEAKKLGQQPEGVSSPKGQPQQAMKTEMR